MSVTEMYIFNETHKTRREEILKDVKYHLISGNGVSSLNLLGLVLSALMPEENDGVVIASLGNGLPGEIDRLTTNEAHNSHLGSPSYFMPGGQSISYTQCLKKVLVNKTSAVCGTIGSSTMAQKSPRPSAATPFVEGRLQQGQMVTRTFFLEGGPSLFAAQWQTGTLNITLVAPNGQLIDPEYAVGHSELVSYTADAGLAIYYLPNAEAGAWHFKLRATAVPTEGSMYMNFAASDSTIKLTARTEHLSFIPGDVATISATLTGPPATSEVTATILRADGLTDTVNLQPSGGESYQASYTIPNAPGYMEIRLFASGTTANSLPFERGRILLVQIIPTSEDERHIYLPIIVR